MPQRTRRAKLIPIHAPAAAPVHPFDHRYQTDTGGLIPRASLLTGHKNDPHITAYYAVAPSILDALVERWLDLDPPLSIDHYTFLDIGAGKGRAMLSAALHPFLAVVGIELNPALASTARANILAFESDSSVSMLSPITLWEADALAAPLPSGPTLAFMFHPFEAPILRSFLHRVEQYLAAGDGALPGVFYLLYVNAEHASVFEQNPAFTCLFKALVPMSPEDYLADLAEIAEQEEYGSTGDELCAIYRFVGRTQ